MEPRPENELAEDDRFVSRPVEKKDRREGLYIFLGFVVLGLAIYFLGGGSGTDIIQH
jgi:hypothetical protein